MKLCIFNPDNDLALSNGTPDYCPPKEIVTMEDDLWEMPEWWYGEEVLLYKPFHIYSPQEIKMITQVEPWGWNLKLKKALINLGIAPDILPDNHYIDYLRELSHRRSSILLLTALGKDMEYKYELPITPTEIFTLHDGIEYFKNNPNSLFKTPWSSSGKGLFWVTRMSSEERDLRLESSLSKFGSVIAENYFDKVIDFAMLFDSNGEGDIKLKGYSLFNTDEKGAYISNILTSDENIKKELSKYVSIDQINILESTILKHLPDIIGKYKGCFGIDMMIYKDEDKYMVHPCVEMNMRRTMGMAAHDFYNKFCVGSQGTFHVVYKKDGLKDMLDEILKFNPLVIKDGKIEKGFTSLTSYNDNTKFCIYAIIN